MAWRVWHVDAHAQQRPCASGCSRSRRPAPAAFGKLLKDTFVAPQSLEIEPALWTFAMLFHVAALAAFFGHLRLVHEFTLPRGRATASSG